MIITLRPRASLAFWDHGLNSRSIRPCFLEQAPRGGRDRAFVRRAARRCFVSIILTSDSSSPTLDERLLLGRVNVSGCHASKQKSFQEPRRSVFGRASGPHVAISLLVPSLGDSHGTLEKFSGPPTLPSSGHAADVNRGEAARKPGVLSHGPPHDCLRPAGVLRVACAAPWAGAWRSYFLAAETRRCAAVALPGIRKVVAAEPATLAGELGEGPPEHAHNPSTFTMNERGDFLD